MTTRPANVVSVVAARSSGGNSEFLAVPRPQALRAPCKYGQARIGEIDIFKSGLVFRDNGCLQITNAGRSLLHSLYSSGFSDITKPGNGQ
jgi:hypothetical protein